MNRAALSPSSLWSMTKESFSSWSDDFAPSMGAAIAYYTIFSIAPLLVIVIAIAGLVFGQDAASGALYGQISGMVGDEGGRSIQTMVQNANSQMGKGIVATILAAIVLLLGATGVFAELQNDLDRIWRSPAAAKTEGIWNMIRGRLLSLGMVASIGFLLLVSLAISAALAALGGWWGGVFGELEWLLHLVNFLVSIGVVTVLFALMYKILPRVKLAWRDVWIGSIVTALLFTIGKFVVGLYIGKSSVASGFGAAGALAVMLVWVYYSAQIFLLGAEFTGVYAHRFGSKKGEARPARANASKPEAGEPQAAVAAARQPAAAADAHGTPAGAGAAGGTGPAGKPVHFPPGATPANAATMAPARPHQSPGTRNSGGIMAAARRHPGLVTAGALLLGVVAGEVLNRRQAARHGRQSQRTLASQLAELRAAAAPLAPLAIRAVREQAERLREAARPRPRTVRKLRRELARLQTAVGPGALQDRIVRQARQVRDAVAPAAATMRRQARAVGKAAGAAAGGLAAHADPLRRSAAPVAAAVAAQAGQLRKAAAPTAEKLREELQALRRATPRASRLRRSVRRERAKAASAIADKTLRARHWLAEHLPWRRRSVLQRLRERATHAAQRA